MGRPAKKETVEAYISLDINILVRRGTIKTGQRVTGSILWNKNGEPNGSIGFESCLDLNPSYIRLYYTRTGRPDGATEDINYKVYLTTTPVYLGGNRFWFICSGEHCGRRVGKLYAAGKYFFCRHCYNLTYNSCRASHNWDFLYKIMVRQAGIPLTKTSMGGW